LTRRRKQRKTLPLLKNTRLARERGAGDCFTAYGAEPAAPSPIVKKDHIRVSH
jgi:hypothetical protein